MFIRDSGLWKLWEKFDSRTHSYPLLCHMPDVSAVAARLGANFSRAMRNGFEGRFGGTESMLSSTSLCAALHDLGKASPAFQIHPELSRINKRAIGERHRQEGFPIWRYLPEKAIGHGTIVSKLSPTVLAAIGFSLIAAESPACIVAGHHGAIPERGAIRAPQVGREACGSGEWDLTRQEIANALAETCGVDRLSPAHAPSGGGALALTGLVSVADWIGSMSQWFRFAETDGALPDRFDLAVYAATAATNAAAAFKELHWANGAVRDGRRSFEAVFPAIVEPNDLRRAATRVVEGMDEPALVIMEAPTGEGKSEAALYPRNGAARRLGRTGSNFALPAQAAGNQMFSRMREVLARTIGGEDQPRLLHGHADLSAELRTPREAAARSFTPIYGEDGNPSATGVGAEWFTYRKRGLLAPLGVGSVEPAVLAVLRPRYFFVRMFGLGGKTIVIDEVHAYGTHMSALMERLLEWLAASGSLVFLLSATLPSGRRKGLPAAYLTGLGAIAPSVARARDPRISCARARGRSEIEVWANARVGRTLRIRRLGGAVDLGAHLRGLLAEGGCAAVICNTVRRAQDVHRLRKPLFGGTASDGEPELMLLQARFPFEERERRDKLTLIRFGPPGSKVAIHDGGSREVSRPHRSIIVATQVIEQSLDLDFDAMISEFAPAGLLLQRAGRPDRHQRRQRAALLSDPTLDILMPEMGDERVPEFGQGTDAVYDSQVRLRSWVVLRDRERIEIPEQIEGLIGSVYAKTVECPHAATPALRKQCAESAIGHQEDMEQGSRLAKMTRIPGFFDDARFKCDADFKEDNPEIHASLQARARLCEGLSVEVALAGSRDADSFDPGAVPGRAREHYLLRRSVKMSQVGAARALLSDESRRPRARARSALLRHHRLVKLDARGSARAGEFQPTLGFELGVCIGAQGVDGGSNYKSKGLSPAHVGMLPCEGGQATASNGSPPRRWKD